MYSRARHPPPGMGGGGGRGVGVMQPNSGTNFQPRNPTQQYVQRSSVPNNQYHQTFQNSQPQQWLRRDQLPAVDSSVDEVEKTVQSEAVDLGLGLFPSII